MQPRLSQDQFEQCLMRGFAPSKVTGWLEDSLRESLDHALKINPDLFQAQLAEADLSDSAQQWLIPEQYQSLDIRALVLSLCRNQQDRERAEWELDQFESKSLLPVLRAIKFVIDTLRENKILWGVGRGSSVSSLTLYLLGVHRIDPMLWNLDPEEFFR